MASVLSWLFVLAVVVFVGYALYAYYGAQPTDQSKAKRVWGALVAAAMAIGGLIVTWFQSPPPT